MKTLECTMDQSRIERLHKHFVFGGHRASRLLVLMTAAASFALALTLGAAGTLADGTGDNAKQRNAARAASKELGGTLKKTLIAALAAGGPASAIGVCKSVAIQVAEDISRERGLLIRRTSLRVRNPNNGPDAYERKVLEDFVAEIASGADAATLERSEIVVENGRKTFRYMKAIPTAAAPCLACHGTDIAPDVKSAIQKSYPDDQATGFKAGDLRGAFSVSQEVR
jgi:Protein of unknown function (DUF3365)